MKSKFLKNCMALLAVTFVAGLALSFVNEITKEPIAAAEEKARQQAYETVFKGAQFKSLDNMDELLAQYAVTDAVYTIDDVLAATDENGNIIGYVMSATSLSGYGGDIKTAVGISTESETITGFSVLSNSETAGLGISGI